MPKSFFLDFGRLAVFGHDLIIGPEVLGGVAVGRGLPRGGTSCGRIGGSRTRRQEDSERETNKNSLHGRIFLA